MPRVPPRFHCACPAGKCSLAVLQSDAPLPADLAIGYYSHHEVLKRGNKHWFESRQNSVESGAVKISLEKPSFVSSMAADRRREGRRPDLRIRRRSARSDLDRPHDRGFHRTPHHQRGQARMTGGANGSREYAPDDKLRDTHQLHLMEMMGFAGSTHPFY